MVTRAIHLSPPAAVLPLHYIFYWSPCSVWILSSVLPRSLSNMSDADQIDECLPLDDVALIRPLLAEFKSAKRGDRKHVVRKGLTAVMATRDTTHLRPLAQAKIIAQVKEVRVNFSWLNH
jgi:hypothetical protein